MFLRGVVARGHHGVLACERRDGQDFVVDVDWWLETAAAAAADRLDATVCYQQIQSCVVEIVAGPPYALIESLADALAAVLLARFRAIEAVKVTVHKPEAPLDGAFSDVGVCAIRRRAIHPHVIMPDSAPSE